MSWVVSIVVPLVTMVATAQDNSLSGQAGTSPLFRVEDLPFVHEKGDSGRRYIVETMGSGGALFDADGDGDLDLYLLNGAPLPGCDRKATPNRLLLNDGRGRFTPVDGDHGLNDSGYAMGCCVGDIDGDGDPDLYLTQFGKNRLFRNEGGRFVDVTDTAGVGDAKWGASAGFADFDRDGDLDLYVSNYLEFTIATHKPCTLGKGIEAYCSPDAYPAARDVIYRNRGDGTFEDVTTEWGIVTSGKGLGVLCLDFDRDGWVDIYVANDGVANTLYRNTGGAAGKKRFEDVTLFSGVGYNDQGMAQAGMGVIAADFVGDGFPEIFVTNLSSETNVLYRSRGQDWFEDATVAARLGAPSLLYTGFGTVSGDFDLDGDFDLFVANGHVIDNITEFYDYYSYEQPDQFYENKGGKFRDVTSTWLPKGISHAAGRGAMSGDVDGDGDLDIVVTNCGGKAQLYRNSASLRQRHWLMVELRGSRCDPIGARVEVVAGGKTRVANWNGGGSYLSHSATLLHFGLGKTERIDRLRVLWPGGSVSEQSSLAVDRRVVIHEPKPTPSKPTESKPTASKPNGATSGKAPTSRPRGER